MGSPDSARKCIATGGVVMYPQWLKDNASSVHHVRRLLRELANAHEMAADPFIRGTILGRCSELLDGVGDELVEAAESTPVRDVATLVKPLSRRPSGT